MILTENQLDEWVRGNAEHAQGVIVELVWRLVAASSPQPRERHFPLGDSIGQPGQDGLLEVDLAFDPFVPEGRSFWEIGTSVRAGGKATSDYRELTNAVPDSVRTDSTFVFVTPLSGRRDWEHTWKENAQAAWIRKRRAREEWRDVRVIDGTKLIDWVHQFPPVELWLAGHTNGLSHLQLETPEQCWGLLRTTGEPPPLTPMLFLANRDEACAKLKEIVAGTAVQLKLETHFPDQVVDFVAAYLADLDAEVGADSAGRWLVVSDPEAWDTMSSQQEKLVLVANPELDLTGETGTKLIQKARRAGHAVIFGGPAGGIPDPASVPLRQPRSQQIQEALVHAGYSEERARVLTQKSGRNLGTLLRCLQNLSLMPEWAEDTVAADLAIAAVIGSWREASEADKRILEGLSGNSYGEWIGKVREAALRPGTPLTQRDGSWKFAARYEGWYALGRKLFDEHLSKLQSIAITVLKEEDPQFELPRDDRYASRIYGKVLVHSHLLRNGLAETLALLGSHPQALISCTPGAAEKTAVLAVREILADADWKRWASLSGLLPLLSEAAPGEFLRAVENSLLCEPCPFDQVFAEEGDGITGGSYMSSLLWALETLAWDPDHLSRVVICLGELAARDPGGRYANRPANSLTTIFLPWLPQTCAVLAKRGTAVSALLDEHPDVGWKLIVSLLPQTHSVSMGTRRPAWREIIPDDWRKGVTQREYYEQVLLYSEMAITVAKNDCDKLAQLIDHMAQLPPETGQEFLTHLGSDAVVAMPEADRQKLWMELVDLVVEHRKFSDAEWAMTRDQVDQIASVAKKLAPADPALRHQRLFSEREFDLYEEKGDYENQWNALEERRQRAVTEVAADGGVESVLVFAAAVQSPWRVGIAFGAVAPPDVDAAVLPGLLETEERPLAQFVGGFVRSRFHLNAWLWVDALDTGQWTSSQIGQFLAFLPFIHGVWERSKRLLGADESAYWSKTGANAYEADTGLEVAVDELIRHGRPHAALRCLHTMLAAASSLDTGLAVRALLSALEAAEPRTHWVGAHEIVAIIKFLQSDSGSNPEELSRLEWEYLALLGPHSGARPRLLEQRLANEPKFFCEAIRLVFRSTKDEDSSGEPGEPEKAIAANVYRLLSGWRFPPGSQADGSYDGEALNSWLDEVKKECAETGHLDIAMTMVGHSLFYVPPDPDGLWIHRAAAGTLNSKDARSLREGFRTELFNSRGAHWVDPTGGAERKLANKHRTRAEAVEKAGYHRLATTLRELAASHDADADRIAAHDQFED